MTTRRKVRAFHALIEVMSEDQLLQTAGYLHVLQAAIEVGPELQFPGRDPCGDPCGVEA